VTQDRVAGLNARDDLREIAELYEAVAALEIHHDPMRAVPGPRVPPGAQEVLDADEFQRALTAVDDDALSYGHIALAERDETLPDSTPGRLRYIADHVDTILDDDDELLVLSFLDDTAAHLTRLHHLARRGAKVIRTGHHCQEHGCDGRLVSTLGEGAGKGDGALVCDREARHVVPFAVWSSWPRMRVQWITVEHAAKILLTTVGAVKVRASRGKWRRVGSGREVRYSREDVQGAAGEDAA
jgi:hypothetical protein